MKASGFSVKVTEVPSTAEYRKKYGVPDRLQSCHTAVVNGYAIEGHVPAADVHRLLKSHAKVKGLAVPGMPIGSPGMEQGSGAQAYSVVSFDEKGGVAEFSKIRSPIDLAARERAKHKIETEPRALANRRFISQLLTILHS